MTADSNLDLGRFAATFNRIPYAITLSDLSLPDQPLVFMNTRFREMTGYGDECIGQNCRFLQGDLDNTDARAEIRDALEQRRRTQVILKNRSKDGHLFYNLLILELVGKAGDAPDLALGTQFNLGRQDPDLQTGFDDDALKRVYDQSVVVTLERRRIASDSALRLLQSWRTLNRLKMDR